MASARRFGKTAAQVFAKSRPVKLPTEASEQIRKATNQAKHAANKQTETEAKELLARQLRPFVLVQWEYRFDAIRKWRFDGIAWNVNPPMHQVAIEIEGRGRHTQTWKRKKSDGTKEALTPFEKDCEKYNTAAILGWRVLRFTYAMIRSGVAADTIRRALA